MCRLSEYSDEDVDRLLGRDSAPPRSSYPYRWSQKLQDWVHLDDLPEEERRPGDKQFRAYPWETT